MPDFAIIEARIVNLLGREGFSTELINHVGKYVEAGEYALVLDMLGDWLVERNEPASEGLVDEMTSLYALMSAHPRNVDFLRARNANA